MDDDDENRLRFCFLICIYFILFPFAQQILPWLDWIFVLYSAMNKSQSLFRFGSKLYVICDVITNQNLFRFMVRELRCTHSVYIGWCEHFVEWLVNYVRQSSWQQFNSGCAAPESMFLLWNVSKMCAFS